MVNQNTDESTHGLDNGSTLLEHKSHKVCFLNMVRPSQNGCHFAGNIFNLIFFNVNPCILIKVSLRFFSEGSIDNMQALVQAKVMSWRQTKYRLSAEISYNLKDKLQAQTFMTQFTESIWHHEVMCWVECVVTHLPLNKMAAISQMIFSDAFSWMKNFVFLIKKFTEVCS